MTPFRFHYRAGAAAPCSGAQFSTRMLKKRNPVDAAIYLCGDYSDGATATLEEPDPLKSKMWQR